MLNNDIGRILALAPSTRGLGYAVMEGKEMLVSCGVKQTLGAEKNKKSLVRLKELITQYKPDVLVMQDTLDSRRAPRIKALIKQISTLCEARKLKITLFTDQQIRNVFSLDGKNTKYERAQITVSRFPNELSFRLPPKRKIGNSEDSRMSLFDAVALAVSFLKINAAR